MPTRSKKKQNRITCLTKKKFYIKYANKIFTYIDR